MAWAARHLVGALRREGSRDAAQPQFVGALRWSRRALGLEQAGFSHAGLVEINSHCCSTLRRNRPEWQVFEKDLQLFAEQDAQSFEGIDLLAGGLPCPPFSIASKQLGPRDERNLFPLALDVVDTTRPRAVMLENVRGLLGVRFRGYLEYLKASLEEMEYRVDLRLLNASDYGVPQLRPRVVIVALRREDFSNFSWPTEIGEAPPTVGETLRDLMAEHQWEGAAEWSRGADGIAPTIVGGSYKHGGPDLGSTRAKRAWESLGVDGHGIADEPPRSGFVGMPRLTLPMVSRLQGFPNSWTFSGGKTAAYRQIGNAFPPPVARAVAEKILECLGARRPVEMAKVGV